VKIIIKFERCFMINLLLCSISLYDVQDTLCSLTIIPSFPFVILDFT